MSSSPNTALRSPRPEVSPRRLVSTEDRWRLRNLVATIPNRRDGTFSSADSGLLATVPNERVLERRPVFEENPHNPLRCATIPEGWGSGCVRRMLKSKESLLHDPLRVGADHTVGSMGDCDRSLGVLPKGETGHAEDGRFFLNAP